MQKHAYSADFEQFWQVFPGRTGGNPKYSASKAYDRALKSVSVQDLLMAATNYAADCRNKSTDPRFIPMCATFLNQRRWEQFMKAVEYNPPGKGAVNWDWVCRMYVKTNVWYAKSPAPGFSGCEAPAEVLRAHGLLIQSKRRPENPYT